MRFRVFEGSDPVRLADAIAEHKKHAEKLLVVPFVTLIDYLDLLEKLSVLISKSKVGIILPLVMINELGPLSDVLGCSCERLLHASGSDERAQDPIARPRDPHSNPSAGTQEAWPDQVRMESKHPLRLLQGNQCVFPNV